MNLKETIDRIIIKELEHLATISKPVKITYDLELTDHAIERQLRHLEDKGIVIKDKEIINIIEKSIPILTNEFIENRININDEIVLTDKTNNLNVVGILKSNNFNEITFIVKTVMIKKNFLVQPRQMKYSI
jgi:hypothetical protein